MPTILKREFAPISDEAWKQLDQEAERVLRRCLVGRKVVDFSGPHGWEFAAINLGRMELSSEESATGVPWGTRQVQPVIEVRVPFTLGQMEIDNITRGAADPDLSPLQDVVARAAEFEDRAVFNGFSGGKIAGMVMAAGHEGVKLPTEPETLPAAVARAVRTLSDSGIGGPYTVALGGEAYFALMQSGGRGYPPHKAVRDLTGGDILYAPVVDGGLVLSTRGGDFELSVGKDFSLGYAGHDRQSVELFVTESFTFRVLEPLAAVPLNPSG